jgi:hypothetical protein
MGAWNGSTCRAGLSWEMNEQPVIAVLTGLAGEDTDFEQWAKRVYCR